jgi:hypothetical protein
MSKRLRTAPGPDGIAGTERRREGLDAAGTVADGMDPWPRSVAIASMGDADHHRGLTTEDDPGGH